MRSGWNPRAARDTGASTNRGWLRHIAAPACLMLGAVWLLLGITGWLAPVLGNPPFVTLAWATGLCAAGLVFVAVGWWLTRRLTARVGARLDGSAPPEAAFTGVVFSDGRSGIMLLEGQDLIVTTTEFRSAPQLAMLMGVGLCGFVVAWFATGGGGGAGLPWRLFLAPLLIGMTHRVHRRHALDEFAAIEVNDTTVRLHPHAAGEPPLGLTLKSWHASRCIAELRARCPEAFDAEPPPAAPERRDELAEMRAAATTWVPDGHSAPPTLLGAAMVAAALIIGAAGRVEYVPFAQPLSLLLCAAAIIVWFQDGREPRSRRDESGEGLLADARRDRRDLLGWLTPWVRTELHAEHDRLTLVRRPIDGFDAVVMAGVASLLSAFVVGSFTPWNAAVCYALLHASGYPRRRAFTEVVLAEHIAALESAGGRATLHVTDQDGPREIVLRFGGGRSKRFAALVRELAPDAPIREPGWRAST